MKTDREYVLDRKRENTKLDVNNREQYQRTESPESTAKSSAEGTKTSFNNESPQFIKIK